MKEDFIKSALLGTAKYTPTYQLDGTDLATLIPSDDKEDAFLKQAASAFLYLEAGQQAAKKQFLNQAFEGNIEPTFFWWRIL